MIDIFKAAVTIMAGGNQHLGAPGLDREQLFRFDTVALDAF